MNKRIVWKNNRNLRHMQEYLLNTLSIQWECVLLIITFSKRWKAYSTAVRLATRAWIRRILEMKWEKIVQCCTRNRRFSLAHAAEKLVTCVTRRKLIRLSVLTESYACDTIAVGNTLMENMLHNVNKWIMIGMQLICPRTNCSPIERKRPRLRFE